MIAFGLSVTMLILLISASKDNLFQYSVRCTEDDPCSNHLEPQEISEQAILCNGYEVCSYSPMLEATEFLHCHGLEACTYSDIVTPWISINGQYAVEGSEITSDVDSLMVFAGGYRAGLGAFITCPPGGQCAVRCFEKSSCYYTTVFYYDMNDVTMEPAACIYSNNYEYTVDHVFCPKLIPVQSHTVDDVKEATRKEISDSEQYQNIQIKTP